MQCHAFIPTRQSQIAPLYAIFKFWPICILRDEPQSPRKHLNNCQKKIAFDRPPANLKKKICHRLIGFKKSKIFFGVMGTLSHPNVLLFYFTKFGPSPSPSTKHLKCFGIIEIGQSVFELGLCERKEKVGRPGTF